MTGTEPRARAGASRADGASHPPAASVTRQKGAASSDPSAVKRWLVSRIMTRAVSDARQTRRRARAEAARRKQRRAHVVEYFHQVDDGYSHLALQILRRLKARYDIEIRVHLVPALRDDNVPEPDLLSDMSRWDAASVAPHYDLHFPQDAERPREALSRLALSILGAMDDDRMVRDGPLVSESLWRGDVAALERYAADFGTAPWDAVSGRLETGAARRAKLKHYSGAMFWYEGEWYWGVDRLCHLEDRLCGLGAARDASAARVAPRPAGAEVFPEGAKAMTLEFFPSLRSPYTAIAWEPTMALARDSGVALRVRPVLPMVMRGVPATYEKGFYIWTDVRREARHHGVEFGNFYDPIGAPIKQGYSLYVWAQGQGRGNAFLGAFLRAAFAMGINTNTRSGMRKVAQMAGLDWAEARQHLQDDTWAGMVEENRQAMYAAGLWGVPSYRLLDAEGQAVLSVWGQDRLWLVSRKIAEHAG